MLAHQPIPRSPYGKVPSRPVYTARNISLRNPGDMSRRHRERVRIHLPTQLTNKKPAPYYEGIQTSISKVVALIRFSQRDERGITHLLLLVAGVGVLAVIFTAGYMVFNHSRNSGKDAVGLTTSFSRCLSKNSNDSRICNFEKSYVPVSQAAYTADVSVTSPQGTLSNLTYSTDGKGDSDVEGASEGQQLSSIVLSGATYIKISGSDWVEYSSGSKNAPAQTDPTASMNIGAGQSNLSYQYVDTEACGSLTCYKYNVSDKTQPNVTQDIWFDTASYKLREWSYHGSTGSTTMTISYQPITITAPSQVKVIPAS
jgi:hypothetical protein